MEMLGIMLNIRELVIIDMCQCIFWSILRSITFPLSGICPLLDKFDSWVDRKHADSVNKLNIIGKIPK